ncbi:MAG: AraC family transcriptional regulator [Phormidesmis sp.]
MSTHTPDSIARNLLDLPCAPIVFSSRAQWETIQLALFHQPPHRIPEHISPHHVICINAGKPVTLEQTIDGKTCIEDSVPGDIGIYPAHLWQSFEWHQNAEFLQLYLEPIVLNRISSELYGKDSIELLPRPTPIDPVISQIAIALQNTLNTQSTGCKLYIDAMANALATHLVYHYSAHDLIHKTHSGGLSDHQLKRVTDYIDEHLAEDLSLSELAGLVPLSSFHFARLFKSSTGFAPHQYHIRCRMKRTKQLLLEKELSIAQVAHVVGFASQSHLNYHFKRIVGLTPTAFLRQQ